MIRVVTSTSSAARLIAASRFLSGRSPSTPVFIVAVSRGAADDFARELANESGATFGVHRFSLTQFAARIGAVRLASSGEAPATPLGLEAVAARALFDAASEEALTYFAPVALTPGFPGALARTLQELALASIKPDAIRAVGTGGGDLADLYERFGDQLRAASAADRSAFFAAATGAVAAYGGLRGAVVVLLDVPVQNNAEAGFVSAIARQAADTLITTPAGDRATVEGLRALGQPEELDTDAPRPIDRVRRYLFADRVPDGEPLDDVELFSAPGEGREAVEIVRRVMREAARGVAFDQMAIVVRPTHVYGGLLEHALRRAGVPAYFDRGTRRPHPAGRAFLSILACAAENVSVRRFAEYLSLGQVPEESDEQTARADTIPLSNDDVFGVLADRAQQGTADIDVEGGDSAVSISAVVPRSPWRWERLLVDSRVVASEARWRKRLNGLLEECELQRRELLRTEPDSPRLIQLERQLADLHALTRFALPIVEMLAVWPHAATWGEWLDAFDALAPRVLKRPEHVMRVLSDLRPMRAIGPVLLDEAIAVLSERLATTETEPPPRRYGRVFVTNPSGLRGRVFDVVFIAALAERMFPQKAREDPLLLDDARTAIDRRLVTQPDRADQEKLHLRLALGAARHRVYASFPTLELAEGRPRVPSLYALEIWRAMTGRVPGADELQRTAARSSHASLAWPAPVERHEAIDVLEHDLATLRDLEAGTDEAIRGRARYILKLNDALGRSVRTRFMRGRRSWSRWDGLVGVTEATAPGLSEHRLTARTYSASALQKYAVCPYQFLLSAIYRLRPAEEAEPLQRLDPLTKGSLFHEIQATLLRKLKSAGDLPMTAANRTRVLMALDAVASQVAGEYHDRLAPAVERVWSNEIGAVQRDLRLWVDDVIDAAEPWKPVWFEWSFGLNDAGRDPESRHDPVAIDGRFPLRGSIDLVEQHETSGALRVTDHKTGKYRGKNGLVIDGGRVLQPVLYGVALETATGRPVVEGRLYYATTDGAFQKTPVALTPASRRAGIEVLEIIDRAVETGRLPPAPAEKACDWCDFRPVCGGGVENRVSRKPQDLLADLHELRRRP